MIARILSAMLLVSVSYTLAVFLMPEQADELGDLLGIHAINEKLRNLKSDADGISEQLIDAKNATGGILDEAKGIIDQTKSVVGGAQSVIETKTDQIKKVYDSAQKTTEAISEFKSNVSELASFTGTLTATGSATGSVSTSSSGTQR